MTIEGLNGKTYDVTGAGQGVFNTVGAAAGIASLLGINANSLVGGNGVWGVNNNGNCRHSCSENEYVNRYDANLMQKMAEKDMEISILKASQDTDKKLVDVYTALNIKDNQMRDRIELLEKEMSAKLAAERESRLIAEKDQAVFNQSAVGNFATVNTQIAAMNSVLSSISTSVVPQNKVCQTGCCGCAA